MNQPKTIFSAVVILFISVFYAPNAFAQTEKNENQKAEQSYDVILQTIIASNASAAKTDVPNALAGVVKKLKSTYSMSNYAVASTYLQRVANTGSVEFKSVSNKQSDNVLAPVFSEWNLGQLWTAPTERGGNMIQVRNFRFGQKIPVRTGGDEKGGNAPAPIVYESVGLTMQKLSLAENIPTVIGSLTTAKSDEIMFLILTVKPSEN